MLIRIVVLFPVVSVPPVLPDKRSSDLTRSFVLGIFGSRLKSCGIDRVDLDVVSEAILVLVRIVTLLPVVGVSPVLPN